MTICRAGRLMLPAVFLAACAPRAALPPAPPLVPQLEPLTGVSVALVWDAPVDLDLYLTDPTWETVYFANTPSRSGARLLRDTRCDGPAVGASIERAEMAVPLAGRYRVGVDFSDLCGAPRAPVSFRVVVDYAGRRAETIGHVRLEEFQPIVVEFELHRPTADGPLVLLQEGQP